MVKQRKSVKPIPSQQPQQQPLKQPQQQIQVDTLGLPILNQIFGVFAFCNFLSAILNPISDCDETYNYWEPTHQLMYGWGFQTWEYSPVFALRSYLYIGIHAAIGYFAKLLGADKIQIFYAVRMALGIWCAFCETVFMKGIFERFGKRVSIFTFVFLLFSSGMFNASTAYLPSSFVMCALMLAFGSWYTVSTNMSDKNFKYSICILACAIAGLLGWPFCIIAVAPLALDTLYHHGFMPSLIDSIKAGSVIIFFIIYVDHFYYGRLFFTPLHLVLYNRGSGSELYGTEPWHFYIRNMFLNFNFILLLAFLAPLAVIVADVRNSFRRLLYLSPFYVWFVFYSLIPHKEERFMFVIYPSCCLAGAVCLDMIGKRISPSSIIVYSLQLIIVAIICVLGVSRTISTVANYRAPLQVYTRLSQHLDQPNKLTNVCVGKEWYRFPSHFFMPNENTRLRYLRTSFRGLLPKYYEQGPDATKVIPTTMNDDNREEMDRYIPLEKCHYLVDLQLEHDEPLIADNDDKWELIHREPFLDAKQSPTLTRAFYIPTVSETKNVFGEYQIFKRIN
jgi:alpha-1,2-mannosyltransferase